jgi:hypothetical protein
MGKKNLNSMTLGRDEPLCFSANDWLSDKIFFSLSDYF